MKTHVAFVLSKQNIDLTQILPSNENTILVRSAEFEYLPSILLVQQKIRSIIDGVIKTPGFNVFYPAYVIINSTPAGFAAGIQLYGFYQHFNTTVHLWVLNDSRNDAGKYISLDQFYIEGYDQGIILNEQHKKMMSG